MDWVLFGTIETPIGVVVVGLSENPKEYDFVVSKTCEGHCWFVLF